MTPSRNVTLIVHFILDNLFPPFVRDSRLFMYPLFYILFRDKTAQFLDFKDKLPSLYDDQINEHYELLGDKFIDRPTDLNRECIEAIDQLVEGETVLDIACGSGFLSKRLAEKGKSVTGMDIIVPVQLSENPLFMKGEITDLPFQDAQFDTVVCTHTLEHIRDCLKAFREIRRVCAKRLIIVVPCQKEYRYTFDLHIHFFPYEYKLRQLVGSEGKIEKLNGDFLFVMDIT